MFSLPSTLIRINDNIQSARDHSITMYEPHRALPAIGSMAMVVRLVMIVSIIANGTKIIM
jgi:hypothetical protein